MATPLSEERLAEMQEWWSEWDGFEFTHPAQFFGPASRALKDVPALLDEVDRLRAIGRLEQAQVEITVSLRQEKYQLLSEVKRLREENGALLTELIDAERYVQGAETDLVMLRARVAALEGVLRSVEWGADTWAYDDDGGHMIPTCPRCLGEKNDGHDDDCALDAALRKADD